LQGTLTRKITLPTPTRANRCSGFLKTSALPANAVAALGFRARPKLAGSKQPRLPEEAGTAGENRGGRPGAPRPRSERLSPRGPLLWPA